MAIKINVEIPIARISSTSENPAFEYKWIAFCPANCRLLRRTDEMTICRLNFNLFSTPPMGLTIENLQVYNQIRLGSAVCVFYSTSIFPRRFMVTWRSWSACLIGIVSGVTISKGMPRLLNRVLSPTVGKLRLSVSIRTPGGK